MPELEAHVVDSSGQPVSPGAGLWVVPVLSGLISLIAGIVVLVAPKGSLETIALILGIYLVLIGCHGLFTGTVNPEETGGRRRLVLTMSALALIAGIIVIIHPGSTVVGIALAFGIFLILSGLRYLLLATLILNRGPLLVRAVLEIAGGVIVVVWPHIGLATVAAILGIYLILGGLLELVVGVALRRALSAKV